VPADRPDAGALVCSCFQIGCNQIAEATRCGATSVGAIGETLKAGTNCGSCRSEIQTLLDEIAKESLDDADIAQAS
jgi:assimilatory nitrate reductase catalytic subunit